MDTKIEGNNLVITCPLNVAGVLSKSGKSNVIASTGGFVLIKDDIKLNLNLIKGVKA